MVNRQVVRCDVCKKLTLVRIQVGWMEKFPLRVPCGGCGILITGIVYFDFEKITGPNVTYENAALTSEEDGDFHIEISSEFLTAKLGPTNKLPMERMMTPFLRAHSRMTNDGYQEFAERVKRFAYQSKNDWPKVRRLNELWLNRRLALLASDIREFFPPARFPMSNEFECFHGLRELTGLFLLPLVGEAERVRSAKAVKKVVCTADARMRRAITAVAQECQRRGLLASFDERRLQLTSAMVEKFSCLVPALGLEFLKERSAFSLEKEGMTTAGFEDLKQFFIDGFELAADLQLLTTLWNNVVHRGHWDKMVRRRKDVASFEHFLVKKKGERVHFLDAGETFDWMLLSAKDSRLRNALAHGATSYDPRTQVVAYYPRGAEKAANRQEIYLLELAEKCLLLFRSVELTGDLLMATRRGLVPGWKPPS